MAVGILDFLIKMVLISCGMGIEKIIAEWFARWIYDDDPVREAVEQLPLALPEWAAIAGIRTMAVQQNA